MKATMLSLKFVTLTLCIAALLLIGAVSATPVHATDAVASGNQPLWFEFSVGHVEDESNTLVTVSLDDQANCCGNFRVLASGSWGFWDNLEEGDWIGVSTRMDDNTCQWTGKLVPGTYFVQLGTGAHMPCTLGVSGQTTQNLGPVYMGQSPAPVVYGPSTLPEPSLAPAMAMADTSMSSTSLNESTDMLIQNVQAAPMPGRWVHVNSNDPVILDFTVGKAVDNDDDNPRSRVSIQLNAGAFRCGRFQVFDSSGKIDPVPKEEEWIGCSCEEEGEYPAWHGELVPGAYRVRVEPHGAKDFMLSVSGEAVSY